MNNQIDQDIAKSISFLASLDEEKIEALVTVLTENATSHLSVIQELATSGKCSQEEAFRLVLQGALRGVAKEARGELNDVYTKTASDVGLEDAPVAQQSVQVVQPQQAMRQTVMPRRAPVMPLGNPIEALQDTASFIRQMTMGGIPVQMKTVIIQGTDE